MSNLSTWPGLVSWIRAIHGEVQDYSGGELLRFLVDGEGIGMHRLVALTDEHWVSFGIKVGMAAKLAPLTALHASFDLPIGGLCVADNYLFLTQKLPLSLLGEKLVHETLAGLVKQGRVIRAIVAKDPGHQATFEHYTE